MRDDAARPDADLAILLGADLAPLALEQASDQAHRQTLLVVAPPTRLDDTDRAILDGAEHVHVFHDGPLPTLSSWILDRLRVEPLGTVQVTVGAIDDPEPWLTEVERAIHLLRVELATLRERGRDLDRNFLANLPWLAESGSLASLAGRFTGRPALVVAGGPSLDRNVERIRDAVGHSLLIAASAAVRPLRDHGIEPDLIVAIDMGPTSRNHLAGIGRPAGSFAVIAPEAHPSSWQQLGDRCFALPGRSEMTRWLEPFTAERGSVETGSSVAHTAFFLARELGCDPIVFAGLDLAFDGDRSHARGVNGKPVRKLREPMAAVPASDGRGTVTTSERLLTYLSLLERHVLETEATVVDASEGGARVRGTEVMTLEEAIRRFFAEPFDARATLSEAQRDPVLLDADSLRNELLSVASRLEGIHRLTGRGLRALDELGGVAPDAPAELARARAAVNEVRRKLLEEEAMLSWMRRSMVASWLETRRMERRIRGLDPGAESEARRCRMQALRAAFRDARRASRTLAATARASAARLQRAEAVAG
ncbi:MAG: DUF115 domain-containing protein [Myxococcales bacterium]|nr:DUF115 domain-containing protein [Myxococcales bacterium]